jgi:hypothetical protein
MAGSGSIHLIDDFDLACSHLTALIDVLQLASFGDQPLERETLPSLMTQMRDHAAHMFNMAHEIDRKLSAAGKRG